MDIFIDRDELIRGLARASAVIDRKHAQLVLTGAYMETTTDGIRITGSDNESAVTITIPATVNKHGGACVDAHRLFSTIRALGAAAVGIKVGSKNRVTIEAGRAKIKLPGHDPLDYPPPPDLDRGDVLTTTELVLRSLVERIAPCVSQDDVRYGLNGMHLERCDGGLRGASTDGHRLAMVDAKFEGTADPPTNALVGRKALAVIRKLLDQDDGRVDVSFGAGALQITRSDGLESAWFRLIDGQFPDYRAILPDRAAAGTVAIFNRMAMVGALKRAVVVVGDTAKAVRVEVTDAVLRVTAGGLDGETDEDVPSELTGEPVTIGASARYLSEVLSAMGGELARATITHPLAPIILDDPSDTTATFVVMPMRLD